MKEPWVFVFDLKDGQHVFSKDVTPEEAMDVTKLVVDKMLNEKQPLKVADSLVVYPSEFLKFNSMRLADFLKCLYFSTKSVFN